MTKQDERGWGWHHGYADRATGLFDTAEEALQDAADTLGVGVTVSLGRCTTFRASDFADFSATLEGMGEAAHGELREVAEEWPDAGKEAALEFEEMLKAAVDAWADKHYAHPQFWQLDDTQDVLTPGAPA